MRHEITISAISHRDVHRMAAVLTGTPPKTRCSNSVGGTSWFILPDFIDIEFMRASDERTWMCDTVEIGGPIVTTDSRGRDHVNQGRRSAQVYEGARSMPQWLRLVYGEMIKELPE